MNFMSWLILLLVAAKLWGVLEISWLAIVGIAVVPSLILIVLAVIVAVFAAE